MITKPKEMKIIFFTIDCFKGREHLMPWRTILEVAKVMVEHGYEASILNACNNREDIIDFDWAGSDSSQPVHVCSVIKNNEAIFVKCKNLKPEVLFIPFTFRDGLAPAKWIAKINCKKIGYMAGGVYDLKSGMLLKKIGGLAAAKPYLMEAITPKCIFAHTLKNIGVSHVIGLTDVSAKAVKNGGFNNVTTIYPGKDSFDEIVPDYSVLDKYELNGRKWLLFSGAPAPTRGAEVLLEAVDGVKNDDVQLVMLMRTDVGSQYERFEKTLSGLKHPERVKIITDRLTREQLRAFFGSAWYAILPFIVIPSEVPLTYFELLSCGTPVVSFINGGTTAFLRYGLLIADKSIEGLSIAIERAWSDVALRKSRSNKGKIIMNMHPTWNQVGMEWINLLKQND